MCIFYLCGVKNGYRKIKLWPYYPEFFNQNFFKGPRIGYIVRKHNVAGTKSKISKPKRKTLAIFVNGGSYFLKKGCIWVKSNQWSPKNFSNCFYVIFNVCRMNSSHLRYSAKKFLLNLERLPQWSIKCIFGSLMYHRYDKKWNESVSYQPFHKTHDYALSIG